MHQNKGIKQLNDNALESLPFNTSSYHASSPHISNPKFGTLTLKDSAVIIVVAVTYARLPVIQTRSCIKSFLVRIAELHRKTGNYCQKGSKAAQCGGSTVSPVSSVHGHICEPDVSLRFAA